MDRIAIYCGSSSGNKAIYTESAQLLGKALVEQGKEMIYGAGSVGLMGVIADEMLALGGKVTGIIPQFLMDWEVGHKGLTAIEITKDMHTRKARMEELSDGFIAMPGGFGTLDELFEILTWGQLDLHDKPVGIYNVNHYLDGILAFMNNAVQEGFVKSKYVNRIVVSSDANEIISLMNQYTPASAKEGKWL